MTRRLCHVTGKQTFPTKGSAERAAANMHRRHQGQASVYHCPCCNGWHLTHYTYRESKDFRAPQRPQKKKDMRIIIDTAFNDEIEVTTQQTDEETPQHLVGIVIRDRESKRVTALTYEQALELVEALKMQIAKL